MFLKPIRNNDFVDEAVWFAQEIALLTARIHLWKIKNSSVWKALNCCKRMMSILQKRKNLTLVSLDLLSNLEHNQRRESTVNHAFTVKC